MTSLLNVANEFGLSWLGDELLLSKLHYWVWLSCVEIKLACQSLIEQITCDGQNGTTAIMEWFKEKVNETDKPISWLTVIDDNSDVQTAGVILFASFPQALCSHNEEHFLICFWHISPDYTNSSPYFYFIHFSFYFKFKPSCFRNLFLSVVDHIILLDLGQFMVYMYNLWIKQKHSIVWRR